MDVDWVDDHSFVPSQFDGHEELFLWHMFIRKEIPQSTKLIRLHLSWYSLDMQGSLIWIACKKKPNLGFLAFLNPLLKLCAGSSNWGFLKLQSLFCSVYCYLCSSYVFYVFILLVLASKFQYKIMIKFYVYGIFELCICCYNIHGISDIKLDYNPFLSNPFRADVRSSFVSEHSGITFINLMLMTSSISNIVLQEFSIRYTTCSCFCIGMVSLSLCLCFNVYVVKCIVSVFM